MENASKALLIAGAILIAIVLITFGVMVLGQGSSVIKDASMSDTEVATFNAKFTSFEGTKVRGSKVNTLLNTVIQHNMGQDDNNKKITINASGATASTGSTDKIGGIAITATKLEKKADTGRTYTVTCSYANSGLINTITITDNK